MQNENSYFGRQSKNSYFAWFNSGIVRAQSGNREKVRIFIDRKVNTHVLSLKIYKQLSGRVHFEQEREG